MEVFIYLLLQLCFNIVWFSPSRSPMAVVKWTTLHYITLHIVLHYIIYCITLHYITLHYIMLCYVMLFYIVLYCMVLYCILLHCIALHYITLHCTVLYCIIYGYVITWIHTNVVHAHTHVYVYACMCARACTHAIWLKQKRWACEPVRFNCQVRSECLTCIFRASCCSARLSWAQVPAFVDSSVRDRKKRGEGLAGTKKYYTALVVSLRCPYEPWKGPDSCSRGMTTHSAVPPSTLCQWFGIQGFGPLVTIFMY